VPSPWLKSSGGSVTCPQKQRPACLDLKTAASDGELEGPGAECGLDAQSRAGLHVAIESGFPADALSSKTSSSLSSGDAVDAAARRMCEIADCFEHSPGHALAALRVLRCSHADLRAAIAAQYDCDGVSQLGVRVIGACMFPPMAERGEGPTDAELDLRAGFIREAIVAGVVPF